MLDALRSDVFRQGKRLMPKVLAGIMVLTVAVLYLLLWIAAETAAEGIEQESLEELRANLRLENVVPFGLALAQQVGAVLVIVLAGSSMGGEYGAGTVRTMVVRTKARWHFVAAKLLDVTAFAFLLMVTGLGASLAVSAAITPSVGGAYGDALTPGFAADVAASLLRATWTTAPYIALAVFLAVWARSTAVAIGVTLAVLFLEGIAGSLVSLAGGVAEDATQLLLSTNVAALLEANGEVRGAGGGGDTAGGLPNPWQAAAVLAVYTAVFAAMALSVFQRRDVTAE